MSDLASTLIPTSPTRMLNVVAFYDTGEVALFERGYVEATACEWVRRRLEPRL